MSKRCEIQKEYYQQYGNYKGNGKYSDKYVSWLENEVIALRQPPVIGSVADAVGRNCPFCGEPCVECSHKATDR